VFDRSTGLLIGKKIPNTTKTVSTTNNTGVKNLPIISTTLDEEIDKNKVIMKKTTDVTIGLASGKIGCTPTSKVVAAVRGIAIKGPIDSMIKVPSTVITPLFVHFPISLIVSPDMVIATIPNKGKIIPDNAKARTVIEYWSPTSRPM